VVFDVALGIPREPVPKEDDGGPCTPVLTAQEGGGSLAPGDAPPCARPQRLDFCSSVGGPQGLFPGTSASDLEEVA
jgi:hypothetical protein